MTLFIAAVALLFFSGIAGICSRKGSMLWERISLALILAGCLTGIIATVLALARPQDASLFLPWAVPGGTLALRIDGLSAVFLFPALLITAAGSLYGAGYWPVGKRPGSSAWLRLFYPLLSGGILVLLVADNPVLFLMAWEVMALAGYFLVVTERQDEETQKAGFIYLIATHTGTMILFLMFAILMRMTPPGSLHLPGGASLTGTTPAATAVFLLGLIGFGLKAGIMPLHIWLPRAHAAAPSHVSALMSGVMIKMGIYGIVRTTGFFIAIPAWWGWTVLALGLVSGILGVALALAQHDLKRLLAYHSVENIGIILIGLGCALLGRTYQVAALTVLGLAGALLHVVNHGLFKALLFLSAGSVIHATNTRMMSQYGGLLRRMPLTGIFFLGGAVAICGLPPLNGFVSEWLIYLGLLHTPQAELNGLALAVLAAPGLALIGGLALLCFTKVFGLSFLGENRVGLDTIHEAPASMLTAMATLLAACLWIGLAPTTVLPLLAGGVAAWQGAADDATVALMTALAPAGALSLGALLLIVLSGLAALFLYLRRRPPVPVVPTWGCGFSFANVRAQYSTSSFAQLMVDLFHWALRTREHRKHDGTLFRAGETHAVHTPDAVLDLLILPFIKFAAESAFRIRRTVQNGLIGFYLMYSAIALCLLLVAVMVLP
jgi:hydrogenase-4 component B